MNIESNSYGLGISVPPRPLDGQEIEEEENCCYCVSSFQNDYVRIPT